MFHRVLRRPRKDLPNPCCQGARLATTDIGAHWQRQWSTLQGRDLDLWGIAAGDSFHIWAVGDMPGPFCPPGAEIDSTGLILSAADGRRTWHFVRQADQAWRAVSSTDTAHVWVVGGNTILSTTNGGATWQSHATGFELDGVAFGDTRHGWVIGIARTPGLTPSGEILNTSDGGPSWVLQETVRHDLLEAIACVPSRAVGSR